MEEVPTVLKRSAASGFVLAALIFSSLASAQTAPAQSGTPKEAAPAASEPVDVDGWGRPISPDVKGQKTAPAPAHDISGTWAPANGFLDGLGPYGAKAMPEDGKPEHELPYTPLDSEVSSLRRQTIP